ncbi:MAG TPA: hypothetical protein VKV15_16450 [Bryobacteraceae bacterium]|nr:hypothetical protein [Bryobacteraceae bacterium]
MPRKAGGDSENPHDLATLLKGLYGKVAHRLNLDPYYISRVARGELASQAVEDALRQELIKIKSLSAGGRGARRATPRKKSASKKWKKKAPIKKRLRIVTSKSPKGPSG